MDGFGGERHPVPEQGLLAGQVAGPATGRAVQVANRRGLPATVRNRISRTVSFVDGRNPPPTEANTW